MWEEEPNFEDICLVHACQVGTEKTNSNASLQVQVWTKTWDHRFERNHWANLIPKV